MTKTKKKAFSVSRNYKSNVDYLEITSLSFKNKNEKWFMHSGKFTCDISLFLVKKLGYDPKLLTIKGF